MELRFKAIERERFNTRAKADHRKRVNYLLVTYLDNTGIEYRKGYEYPVATSYADMIARFPRIIEQ